MGWLYFPKPNNVKQYFEDQVTWEDEFTKRQLLDSAIVNMREYYGALEIIEKATGVRRVTALVIMLDYAPNDYHSFGYKDMDEDMGPGIDNCPERILNLLTPTDHEYAIGWRARCRENIERSKQINRLVEGEYVRFAHPLRFGKDQEQDTFVVRFWKGGRKRVRKYLYAENIGYVRWSTLRHGNWQVV
jgi:hypothetical protein